MSIEFIRQKVGDLELSVAARQQRQLSYFTQSSVQEETTAEYFNAWAERKYQTDDFFLNFVKSVFKTDNFLSFFKYFRQPIASAELINERIKIPLSRVFFSEDSFFKYNINNESSFSVKELDSKRFDETLFNAMLFRHNDIIVTGLKDVNTPFREIIDINNVVAIDSRDSVIHKIAYSASFNVPSGDSDNVTFKLENGFLYIDKFDYIFYYDDFEKNITVPHDLGETPADYISAEAFSDQDAVRKSLFSYVREKMEEYVFLKTLQRMTEPNGAIPIVTKLKTKEVSDNKDIHGSSEKEPMAANTIGGQKAQLGSEVTGSESVLQTGSIISVPAIKKDDGSIDVDLVTNFLNFFHIPVESLNYLTDRIVKIEQDLIVALLGDFSEATEESKNELQVSKSFVSKQDKLRALSMDLSRIRNLSDYKFLALQYGKDNVEVDCFYGSDFFLETQQELFELFEKSPNPIERKDILIKSSRNKNRFNRMKMEREVLLYHLMPYSSDMDFDKAITRGVDDVTFEYQNRFNYWIGAFEAAFGDILIFFETTKGDSPSTDQEAQSLMVINDLIKDIINQSINQSESSEGTEG